MSTPIPGPSVGERFVAERKRLGFDSTNSFAQAAGVSQSGLSKVESDRSVPGGDVLAKAAAMGMDVHFVLTGERRSGVIDFTLLGMCEAALRSSYAAIRPGEGVPASVTLNALTKVYNSAMSKLAPSTDTRQLVSSESERYIEFVDDPANPQLLRRVLFRNENAAELQPAPQVDSSVTITGKSRVAGRDMIVKKKR